MIVMQIGDDAIKAGDGAGKLLQPMPYDVFEPVEPVCSPARDNTKRQPLVCINLKINERKECY